MATNGNENCATSAEYLVVKYVTLNAVKRDYKIRTNDELNYIKLHQITSNGNK